MIEIALMAAAFVLGVPLIMAVLGWASNRPGRPEPRAVRRDSPGRAAILAGGLWLLLTVVGEAFAVTIDFYPIILSDKGEDIAGAFRVLMVLSVPVFTLVLAVLVYGIFRRGFDTLPDDGPPIQGKGAAPIAWFAITAGLTALVIVYPGLTSLHAVLEEHPPDLVVKVEGVQWTWLVSYPDLGVANVRELRLPVDRTVRFEVTSRDVLHSFWVPAFLMKVDAVPGRTTTVSLRPTYEGNFDMDPTIRLQCAELCGLSHANMHIPVNVVSARDFDAWIKEKASGVTAQAPVGADSLITVTARGLKFDAKELTVEAGKPVALSLTNEDAGVPHNWAFYASEDAAKKGAAALFASKLQTGPTQERLEFIVQKAGTYFFRCDVHPTTMTGKLIAK